MEIYLDNAATTKPLTQRSISQHLHDCWYNPSAAYRQAEVVFSEINRVRQILMRSMGMHGGCVFTSGGTEANNIVLQSRFRRGAHYITSTVEHPSVFEMFRHLEQEGARVDYVKPRGFCVKTEDVASLVNDETVLVSIMHVNNETGAINDILSISKGVKKKNPSVLFHSDGVQAILKTPVELNGSAVDYYTVSAHKIHAIKGTGALLMRSGVSLKPMHFGGGQEHTFRAGTENTLGILAFGEALEAGLQSRETAEARICGLRSQLTEGLSAIDGAIVNEPENGVPHIVSVSFEGVRGEVLARLLGEKGICIGTGAACSRGQISRVMLECGVSRKLAEGTVRISFSALSSEHDVSGCLDEMQETIKHLRRFTRK